MKALESRGQLQRYLELILYPRTDKFIFSFLYPVSSYQSYQPTQALVYDPNYNRICEPKKLQSLMNPLLTPISPVTSPLLISKIDGKFFLHLSPQWNLFQHSATLTLKFLK